MADTLEGEGVVEQLRQAIRDSGKGLNALGAECGVDGGRLSRFMRGERDLTLEGAAAVCKALGLYLARESAAPEPKRRKGKGGGD
jgi:hypothetical protein